MFFFIHLSIQRDGFVHLWQSYTFSCNPTQKRDLLKISVSQNLHVTGIRKEREKKFVFMQKCIGVSIMVYPKESVIVLKDIRI